MEGDADAVKNSAPDEAISIHTLRMEGDHRLPGQSHAHGISIHTLRMEGDGLKKWFGWAQKYFNPHPPHGG